MTNFIQHLSKMEKDNMQFGINNLSLKEFKSVNQQLSFKDMLDLLFNRKRFANLSHF